MVPPLELAPSEPLFSKEPPKLLVIDEGELFLGGFNIRLENSRRLYGEGRKRDTHVSISGELARHAATLFDQMWEDAEQPYADFATEGGAVFDPFLVPSFSCLGWKRIACLYAGLIERSMHHVYITTPYFCPGSIVDKAVRQATSRVASAEFMRSGSEPLSTGLGVIAGGQLSDHGDHATHR